MSEGWLAGGAGLFLLGLSVVAASWTEEPQADSSDLSLAAGSRNRSINGPHLQNKAAIRN
jgi:hypothetical protein